MPRLNINERLARISQQASSTELSDGLSHFSSTHPDIDADKMSDSDSSESPEEVRQMIQRMTQSIGVPEILSPIPEELSPSVSSGSKRELQSAHQGEHCTPNKKSKSNGSAESERVISSSNNNSTPNSKKSPSKLRAEARKLKDVAKKMANNKKPDDASCNLDSYWYFFKSGLKFMEFSDSLLDQSKTSEAAEMYFSTASFFNFCIHKYEKIRRTYLISLAYSCKAWCYYQAFNLRKAEIFRNSNKVSTALDQQTKSTAQGVPAPNSLSSSSSNNSYPGNQLMPPNSAGSYVSSGNEWSPDHPITPTVPSPSSTVTMSKNSFEATKKFVQRDSKSLIGFMSALDFSRKSRPCSDVAERHGLSILELETIILSEKLTCQEFLQHIHQEVDKGKDVEY